MHVQEALTQIRRRQWRKNAAGGAEVKVPRHGKLDAKTTRTYLMIPVPEPQLQRVVRATTPLAQTRGHRARPRGLLCFGGWRRRCNLTQLRNGKLGIAGLILRAAPSNIVEFF